MKKLILLLLIVCSGFVTFSQTTTRTDKLYVKNSIYYKNLPWLRDSLLMNNLRIKDLLAGKDDADAVNLKQLKDSLANLSKVRYDQVLFDTTVTDDSYTNGRLFLDSTRQALTFFGNDPEVTHFIGEQLLNPLCINNTGVNISNLKAVYITGATDGKLNIELADNRTYAKSRMIGITTQDIDNGQIGRVTRFGLVKGDLSAFNVGDAIYLGIDGNLTNIRPDNGNFPTYIGIVVDNVIGELYVNPYLVEYTAEINSVRGWPINSNTSIIPISGTRTLTVSPISGTTYYTYEGGVKYIHNSTNLIWSDVEGVHDFYFNGQDLVEGVNLSDSQVREIYKTHAGIARMYWDATNDTIVFINNMRHKFNMSSETWSIFWDFHKCEIIDGGLGLTDITPNGTGTIAADAQFGNNSALIRNQDIITSVPAQAGTVGYTVFYREGLGGNWRSQDGAPFPILTTGTGLAAWNQDVGGTWQLTEATSGSYVPYVFLTSNTLGDKVGTIMPDAQYATVAQAETGALAGISTLLQGLPIKELKAVAIVIFETKTNFTNAVKSRIVSTSEGDDYVDLRTQTLVGGGSGGTTTSFLALTDTPSSYSGQGGKYAQVNNEETGLIFNNLNLTTLRDSVKNNIDSLVIHRSDINSNSDRIKDIENDTTNYNTAYAHSQIINANPHQTTLGQLQNVNDISSTDGQVLTKSGANWINADLPPLSFEFISTSQTLEKGGTYIVNDLLADITLNLPTSPTTGDFVRFRMEDVGFITTLDGNGKQIDGNLTIATKKAWYKDAFYIIYNGTQWETFVVNSDIEDLGTTASNFYDFNALQWQYFRTKKTFSALGSVFSNPPEGFTFISGLIYHIFIDANISKTGSLIQKMIITTDGSIDKIKNQTFVRSGSSWSNAVSNGWHRAANVTQDNTFLYDQNFNGKINLYGADGQINIETNELNKVVLQAPTTSDNAATSLISYSKSDYSEIANVGFPYNTDTQFDINNKIGHIYLRTADGLKFNTRTEGVNVTGDYYKNGSLLSVNDLGNIGDYVTLGTEQTISGVKTFNTDGFNPLILARSGAVANVNLRFAHIGGTRYLGMDANMDLKWGSSTDANGNNLIYHSGNSNKSDVDWRVKQLFLNGAYINYEIPANISEGGFLFKNEDKSLRASFISRGINNPTGPSKAFLKTYDGNGDIYLEPFAKTALIARASDGSIKLYSNGVEKLETTATGIDVTGNITITGTVDGRDVAADGVKLDGIATGAEVNVQSDWNAVSGDAFILNKPTNVSAFTNDAGYITSTNVAFTNTSETITGLWNFTTAPTINSNTIYHSGNANLGTVSWNASQLLLNGININTSGTLTNVAYLNASNTYTSAQTMNNGWSAGFGGSSKVTAVDTGIVVSGDIETVGAGTTMTSTNFILSSDKRLKTDINNIQNTNWVDNIDFKQFYFKNNTKQLRYGVVAQEVFKYAPHLVNKSGSGNLGVSYIDLLIIKCKRQDEKIKEQSNQIMNLEERISKLEKLLQCAN